MQSAAILGASGYSGQETLDRVLRHPELEVVALGSDSRPAPTSFSSASATTAPRRSSRRRAPSSSTSRAPID